MNDADNETSRANSEAKIRADEAKQAKKRGGKPPTAEDLRAWTKRARSLWDGIPTGNKLEDGSVEKTFYNPSEIMRDLIASGATRKRAVRIVRMITGNLNFGDEDTAVSGAGRFFRGGW